MAAVRSRNNEAIGLLLADSRTKVSEVVSPHHSMSALDVAVHTLDDGSGECHHETLSQLARPALRGE